MLNYTKAHVMLSNQSKEKLILKTDGQDHSFILFISILKLLRSKCSNYSIYLLYDRVKIPTPFLKPVHVKRATIVTATGNG